MPRILVFLTFVLAVTGAALDSAGQDLAAVPDTVAVPANGSMTIPMSLLLGNDSLPAGDSVQVMEVSAPMHGQLERDASGDWIYTPESGFVGEDAFTYRFHTLPLQHLDVSPVDSRLQFDATVGTALGSASDQETIPVEGSMIVDLGTDASAIDSIHVVGLDLMNPGNHSLRFDYGSPVVLGSLRILADSGKVRLSLAAPGPASGTTGLLRAWRQEANTTSISVEARLQGTGVLTNQVPTEPQTLATEAVEDLSGSLVVQGSTVLVILNVDSSHAFDLDGNAVALDVTGTLQATGSFQPRRESNEAEVLLKVSSGTDTELHAGGTPFSLEIYPNPVRGAFRVAIKAGSPAHRAAMAPRIEVLDLLGREIHLGSDALVLSGDEMRIDLDASNWSPGLYLVRFTSGSGVATRMFIRR